MKTYSTILLSLLLAAGGTMNADAQGWPSKYNGVMLQGFYWDSFSDSQWTTLEKQADELSEYFSLIWIPQSGNCDGTSMGYNPKYYWDQNSTFGTETELRSMIKTFKAKGLGTIADVVINHRQNKSNWVDFPAETYKGVTYEMVSTDICKDDDDGECLAWANKNGHSLSPNNDSGEGWKGMRDIDHASTNVQKIILAYEDFLLNDLGYTGFRYDVGKGFAAKYFALYNNKVKPQFSVGEVWDSNQTIKNWIDGTKTDGTNTFAEPQSAAFDFQFRYQVRDAINNGNWATVAGSNCLIKSDAYKRYAVTFIENHDTEKRENAVQDPIKKDTLAANAYLIAMPGTPCVFFKHWQAYKKEIKLMIEARKLMGINNESGYATYGTSASVTSICVSGTNGDLIVVVGPNAGNYTRDGWKVLYSGPKFKYLVKDGFDTSKWDEIVKHVEATTEEPAGFQIPSCATLQEGTYAYFEKPASWKSTINVWAWYNGGANLYGTISWPGTSKDVAKVGTNESTNLDVYLWKYSGTNAAPANIIFNDGSSQTADLVFQNGGYYTKEGLQANVADGIEEVKSEESSAKNTNRLYNLNGQRVSPNAKGIVISNGRKFLNK